MFLFSRLRNPKRPRRGGKLPTCPHRCRPRVEALEDRCCPSGTYALVYSTYLGGTTDELGKAVAVDSAGNTYVTGLTTSANFPTTANAYQRTMRGYDAAFVAKFDPNGGLVYSTYLGGIKKGDQDAGFGIAVDSAGNAYVTGSTSSSDFPTTTGAYQTTYKGNGDAFVTMLNATGTALIYSTFLGGSGTDDGFGTFAGGIAVDSAGNAYVAGNTTSSDFPTVNALQSSGGTFVTKLNATGSALLYSTYLSSSGNYGIAVDSSGDAFVTGAAGSLTTTANAYQPTDVYGLGHAFLVELNTNLSGSASLLYGTFLGGSGNGAVGTPDFGDGVAVDSSGNAYVAGGTVSTDFPTTAGAYQTTSGGGSDAFVAKFNPSLSGAASLVYSTYLGGSGPDNVGANQGGIAVDSSGNAYVTGETGSTNFPVLNALQGTNGGGQFDAFVTKVNPTGSGLVYSTFLGGNDQDIARGIAVDTSGNAYVTGRTYSTNFPTKNAYQAQKAGKSTTSDAFVTKIDPPGDGAGSAAVVGPATRAPAVSAVPLSPLSASFVAALLDRAFATADTAVAHGKAFATADTAVAHSGAFAAELPSREAHAAVMDGAGVGDTDWTALDRAWAEFGDGIPAPTEQTPES